MRKWNRTLVSVAVALVGFAWEYPAKVLTAIEHVQTMFALPDASAQISTWFASHPYFANETGPWVLICGGLLSIVFIHVGPPVIARLAFKPLQILYDPDDRKFVLREYPYASLEMTTRFRIGVSNAMRDRSIDDVVVSADRNLIVENTIEVAWNGKLERRIGRLNPGQTEYVELFGIGDSFCTNDPRDVFHKPQRFIIRASGTHAREDFAEFEFDVRGNPKLRRTS
jgi:hypothetical protein